MVVDLVDSQAMVQHYVIEGIIGTNVLQSRQTLECVCVLLTDRRDTVVVETFRLQNLSV